MEIDSIELGWLLFRLLSLCEEENLILEEGMEEGKFLIVSLLRKKQMII